MHNLIGILMGLFVVCVLSASHFTRRALKCLGASHRAELVIISAKSSMINLVVPIVVGIGYVAVVMNNQKQLPIATVIALGVLVTQSIISAVIADRAYRASQMPQDFLKFFRLARAIRIFGALMLFTGIVVWLVVTQNAQPS